MHAMTMDKKRVMVGAILNMVLILFLLLFVSQCLSLSAHHIDTPPTNDTMTSKLSSIPTSAAGHLSRRMLDERRPVTSTSSSEMRRYDVDFKRNADADTRLIHAGKGSFNMTASSNVSEAHGGDRLQVHDECPPSSSKCAKNATSIDPRYGVDKRLVPTGPNPLHN